MSKGSVWLLLGTLGVWSLGCEDNTSSSPPSAMALPSAAGEPNEAGAESNAAVMPRAGSSQASIRWRS